MAVSTNVGVASSDFTPFRTAARGGDDGYEPVGTLFVNGGATGDVTGGTVEALIRVRRDILGFPMIWIPTMISVSDTLAAAEEILVALNQNGNARIHADLQTAILTVRASGTNAGIITDLIVPIEPDQDSTTRIIQAVWATNTDGKAYHLHVFGPVFDRQLMAEGGRINPLVAGIR